MDSIITKDVLAFLKPFNSELPDDDPENYYLEREWRKFGCLEFRPPEVEHVLIKRGFVERLIRELPAYAEKIHIATE